MNCEDCELTLPCYAGKLTRYAATLICMKVHACPYCERIFVVNQIDKWWDFIDCEPRANVVHQTREHVRRGFGFDGSSRQYNPSDILLKKKMCNMTVDDPGPGEKLMLWICPACADPVIGMGVPRYIGIQRKWLYSARQIDTGRTC